LRLLSVIRLSRTAVVITFVLIYIALYNFYGNEIVNYPLFIRC
jgi:hypothetical protein